MNKTKDIATIYSLYVHDLSVYATYLGMDKTRAMDVIHDVFCKLTANPETTESIDNIKFYLFKALKNRVYDLFRARQEHVGIHTIDTSDEMPFNIRVTVEDDIIRKEEQNKIKSEVEEILSILTSRQREIIYLRFVQEYGYEEIAELLNINVHSCRKLLSKAMQQLRKVHGKQVVFALFLILRC